MIIVGRPLGGTSLNGLEFLLDGPMPEGKYMKFEDVESAKAFLREEAYPDATDQELDDYFTFMTEEEAHEYEANNSDTEG